jgi:hypothetical protein
VGNGAAGQHGRKDGHYESEEESEMESDESEEEAEEAALVDGQLPPLLAELNGGQPVPSLDQLSPDPPSLMPPGSAEYNRGAGAGAGEGSTEGGRATRGSPVRFSRFAPNAAFEEEQAQVAARARKAEKQDRLKQAQSRRALLDDRSSRDARDQSMRASMEESPEESPRSRVRSAVYLSPRSQLVMQDEREDSEFDPWMALGR